jgi:hypothetical protein
VIFRVGFETVADPSTDSVVYHGEKQYDEQTIQRASLDRMANERETISMLR